MIKIYRIFLLLMFLVSGICDALAAKWSAGQTVYFQKPDDWTAAYVSIGNSTKNDTYPMTQLGTTNIYYCYREESTLIGADAWYITDNPTTPSHRTANQTADIDIPRLVIPVSTGGSMSCDVLLSPVVWMGHQWDETGVWTEDIMLPHLNADKTAVDYYSVSQSLAAGTTYGYSPSGKGFKIRVNDEYYGGSFTLTYDYCTNIALQKTIMAAGYAEVSRAGITTCDARDYEFHATLASGNQPLLTVTNYPAYRLSTKEDLIGYYDRMSDVLKDAENKTLNLDILRDVTEGYTVFPSNANLTINSNYTLTILNSSIYVFGCLTLNSGTYRGIPQGTEFNPYSLFRVQGGGGRLYLNDCHIDASALCSDAIWLETMNNHPAWLEIYENANCTIEGGKQPGNGKYGIYVVDENNEIFLASGNISGGAGAIRTPQGTPVCDILYKTYCTDYAYYEADGTNLYSGWLGDYVIPRTVVVKEGKSPEQNFKLEYTTECGNDTIICYKGLTTPSYIASHHSPATITLLEDDVEYDGLLFIDTNDDITFVGNGHDLTLKRQFDVLGKLTLRGGIYYTHDFSDTELIKVRGGELTLEDCDLCADVGYALVSTTPNSKIMLKGGKLYGEGGAINLPEGVSVASILAPYKGYYKPTYKLDEPEWELCSNLTDHIITNKEVKVDDMYRLTVGEQGWASLCLPYDARVPEGATAYYIPSGTVTDNILTTTALRAGNVIPARNGVFVHACADEYDFAKVTSDVSPITNIAKGVVKATDCEANANYVFNLSDSKPMTMVLNLNEGTTQDGNSAYIPASDLTGVQEGKPLRIVVETLDKSKLMDALKVINSNYTLTFAYSVPEGATEGAWLNSEHTVRLYNNGSDYTVAPAYTGCMIIAPTDCSGMFSTVLSSKLNAITFDNFNTSSTTTMTTMFSGCSALTSLNLSGFDTENVTNMRYMFKDCSSLASLNVNNFNTTNVKDMNGMFSGCSALTSLDLSDFNTSSVTSMVSLFNNCSQLKSLTIGNLDMSKVTSCSEMFSGTSSLTNLTVKGVPYLNSGYFDSKFNGDGNTVIYQLDDNSVVFTGNKNYLPAATEAPTYTRSIAADSNWGTVVLPFEAKSDDDVQLYSLSSVDNNNMHFLPAATIAANTPCVFSKLTDGATSVTFTANSVAAPAAATIAQPAAVNEFAIKGTYVKKENQTGIYYIAQNKFWWAEDPITIAPFRAWFTGPEYTSTNAKAFNIIIDEDGETNGIHSVNSEQSTVNNGKFLVNGQVVILKNGKKYNLNGQEVK